MVTVDWNDPCARAAALQQAYYALLTGGGETLIRRKGPQGEEEVRYHPPDLDKLAAEMTAAQAECATTTNGTNPRRRFAIRGGASRTRFPGQY
jgi:hypothetical protein